MQTRRGNQLASRALTRLHTIPGKPVYPLRWRSRRQQQAYFASNGFGGGIPHQRRGTIAEAFGAEFIPTESGGIVALTNPYEEARFIHGPDTQPFHLDTGWVQIDDITEDFFREAEDVAVAVFYEDIDILGGV